MRLRPPLWVFVLWLVITSTPGSQAARAEADSETWQATQKAMEDIMGNGAAADLAWEVSWADLGRPATGNASTAPRPVKNELVQCLNKAYSAQPMTWDIAMHNTLASLRVLAMFRHEAQPQIPVTIVTTGSLDRLQQLRAQCKSWTGPSSMAVFIPVVQSTAWPLTEQNQEMLRDYVLQVAEFVAELKQHSEACQPTVLLLYEVFVEDIAAMLFPVNMLRNYARLGARTPLVAMLDADLLPSRTLSDRLAQPEEASRFVEQVTKERAVYILPAFDLVKPYETALWADALATAPNKSLAVWGMQNWMLAPFHVQRWPRGHKLTNFQKWMVAQEDYTVRYQTYCEPWFIGSRTDLPWHDERYRGFGMNKIQHVHHVNHAGFQFRVMHDAFVVHRPHKHGAAEAVYKKRGKATNSKVSLRAYTERLFSNQFGMLKRGKDWSPALSGATSRCRGDLSWFQAAAPAAQQPAGQVGQQGSEQRLPPLVAGGGLLVRAQALFTIT